MTYKVGDRVIVNATIDEAEEIIGKIGTVISIDDPEGCKSNEFGQWLTVDVDDAWEGYPFDANGNVVIWSEEVDPVS